MSDDKLETIFRLQDDLTAFIHERRGKSAPKWEDALLRTSFATIAEVIELVNEINWKPWKNATINTDDNRDARLMETVDVLHFVVQLALEQGFSAQEIYDGYLRKNEENRARQISDPRYAVELEPHHATRAQTESTDLTATGPTEPTSQGISAAS